MKILVISQYFWPENFRVNDLCENLLDKGHEVSILTGKPNYPNGRFYKGYNFLNKHFEIWNGIKIYRCALTPRLNGNPFFLFLNYFSFAFFSSIRLISINDKFDKIIVYQLSPATIGVPGYFAKIKFNAPIYFYIQDLWPESLKDAGGFSSKFGLKLVNNMMNFFYRNSKQIWVQSESFQEYLIAKGVESNKIRYLPNTVEYYYKPETILNEYKQKFPRGFNLLFAGNIGVAQDFDTLIRAAEILNTKKLPINWIIIGEGRERNNVENKIKKLNLSLNFYFFGSYPSTEMPFYFACADVLIVSLKKSLIFSLTIPSKLQSYLACQKAIIGNIDGIGNKIIRESISGLCSPSGDFLQFANNIEKLYFSSLEARESYAINGHLYFLNNFERNTIYSKLEQYITE